MKEVEFYSPQERNNKLKQPAAYNYINGSSPKYRNLSEFTPKENQTPKSTEIFRYQSSHRDDFRLEQDGIQASNFKLSKISRLPMISNSPKANVQMKNLLSAKTSFAQNSPEAKVSKLRTLNPQRCQSLPTISASVSRKNGHAALNPFAIVESYFARARIQNANDNNEDKSDKDIPEKLILTEHAEFDKSCKSVESPEKLTAFDQANSEEPKNQAIDPLQSGGTFSPEETLVTMEKRRQMMPYKLSSKVKPKNISIVQKTYTTSSYQNDYLNTRSTIPYNERKFPSNKITNQETVSELMRQPTDGTSKPRITQDYPQIDVTVYKREKQMKQKAKVDLTLNRPFEGTSQNREDYSDWGKDSLTVDHHKGLKSKKLFDGSEPIPHSSYAEQYVQKISDNAENIALRKGFKSRKNEVFGLQVSYNNQSEAKTQFQPKNAPLVLSTKEVRKYEPTAAWRGSFQTSIKSDYVNHFDD